MSDKKKGSQTEPEQLEREDVVLGELSDLVRERYAAFAVSSNARGIPDARDGFKPVHRRILYGTKDTAPSSRGTVKSALIVGDILGKYHPHGDSSVYDALCRMTLDFANNTPLIKGQGNFGAIDGSSAAAMRYTEAKLSSTADWLVLDGVDEEAVEVQPNYDGRLTEPKLLPVKLPYILLNGVPGGSIGVGFASQIPPHNPTELIEATLMTVRAMVEGREVTVADLMTVMPGPDFPTGGIMGGPNEIANFYATGQGSVKMRATAEIETSEGRGGDRIIFTAVPYGLTTEGIVSSIGEAAIGKRDPKSKQRGEPTIPEIRTVRDETSTDRRSKQVKVRIVVELKQDANPEVILEKLYRNTQLESSFPVNMTALDENRQPRLFTLIELISNWANFRADCVRRTAASRLEKARDREHVIQGLLIAIPKIAKVIETIRKAGDDTAAALGLRELLKITSRQADAILAMQLRRLTGLRTEELKDEAAKLATEIAGLLDLLVNEAVVVEQICAELEEAKSRIGSERKTLITDLSGVLDPRSLIVPENCLVSITGRGYLKRLSADEFRAQNRGGKGKRGAKVKDDDELRGVVSCHSHDRLFAVTDCGSVVRLEAHEIPISSNGRHAANLGFEEGELVRAVLPSPWPLPEAAQVVVAKTDGDVKRVMLSELSSRVTKRLNFYSTAAEGDVQGGIMLPDGSGDVFVASAHGLGTRFSPEDIRLSKRDSGGVRGMDLRADDRLVSLGHIESDDQLILCITSDGIGKRVAASQFPVQNRGGKGRILIKPRPGAYLVEALVVRDSDNVLFATERGMTVRIRVGEVRELGRSAMGCRLITLADGDKVVSAAVIPAEAE